MTDEELKKLYSQARELGIELTALRGALTLSYYQLDDASGIKVAKATNSTVTAWVTDTPTEDRQKIIDDWWAKATAPADSGKEGPLEDEREDEAAQEPMEPWHGNREIIAAQAEALGMRPSVWQGILSGSLWPAQYNVAEVLGTETELWTGYGKIEERRSAAWTWWSKRSEESADSGRSAKALIRYKAIKAMDSYAKEVSDNFRDRFSTAWANGEIVFPSEMSAMEEFIQAIDDWWTATDDLKTLEAQAAILNISSAVLFWLLNTNRRCPDDANTLRIREATQTPAELWLDSNQAETLNHRRAAVAAWWKSRQELKAAWETQDWSKFKD
jgi:hypothetical protein